MSSPRESSSAPASWVRGPIADLYSSYVAAAALSAAQQLGILDRLAEDGQAPFGNGGDESLSDTVVRAVHRTLHWARVVEVKDEEVVIPGALFAEAYAARGYFYWLVKGCGELFSIAPDVALAERRTGDFYHRDMRAVAVGSRLIGDEEVEPLFDRILADPPVGKVADLGCGSGQRLIRILGNHPDARGVGVDIAPAAVQLAAESVESAGLSDRITLLQGDVLELEPRLEFADVDTVTCVFMGHDFWPYDSCVQTLRRLRTAFPAARRLLICDVVRTSELPSPDTTIFTLGFEAVHALMGDYLPTLDQWQEAFRESGWKCLNVQPTTVPPNGYLFELSPVAD
ncbi:methyltransferase domain-containing protein [Streptomyces sp. SID9124]|uniref:class I SAM-dependent methyltransferase n=1 Tax=Streptomyces sp. SID9124 TaxID=2706108 RepID=UPI0013DFED46|nr:methyltransferase domain-containing protein [Streptomyces sp. SID9124]NED11802.1 methyltransferase domain-containing protein [Streptomyces sp. SID9124]